MKITKHLMIFFWSFFLLEPKSKSKWQKNLLFLKAYTLLILCHHCNLLFPFHITTINTFTSHHVFLSPSLPLPWTAATSPPLSYNKNSFHFTLLDSHYSLPPPPLLPSRVRTAYTILSTTTATIITILIEFCEFSLILA